MGSVKSLLAAFGLVCLLSLGVQAQYSQDFDSLTAGEDMAGSDEWALWDDLDDDTLDAEVSDTEAFNGKNSLSILTTTDIVRAFSDEFTSGGWTVSAQVFVPGTMTGAGYFILLNTYSGSGGSKNWSTQVIFDADLGEIRSIGGSGFAMVGTADLTTDAWIEITVRIDLDGNSQEVFLDGVSLASGIWQASGSDTLECIDLYGNTATPNFYYDDLKVFADCDLDGVDDAIQIEGDPELDCDEDGVLDDCGIDCDDNGVPDSCDIDEDASLDCDEDGTLDECQEVIGVASREFPDGLSDDDQFGEAVDVSGTVAVVAATRDSEDENDAGAVYIYRLVVDTWVEEQRLVADDAAIGDWFGSSVAIDGDRAVVGVYRDDDDGGSSGSVYVFEYSSDDGEWSQADKLTASNAGDSDQFGWSVDLSGDRLVVGARATDGTGVNSGSVYVFDYNSTTEEWTETDELTASDAASMDQFGRSVATSGNWLVVGASAADPSSASGAGKAYVFELTTTWTEVDVLTASDLESGDQFGRAVAISGDTLLVGAPGEGDAFIDSSGAVYQFDYDGSDWNEEEKWQASDLGAGAEFGDAVSISGTLAVVGAYQDSSDVGAAYLFHDEGTTWAEIAKFTPDGSDSDDLMGRDVAVEGAVIAMGAVGDGDDSTIGGSVYFSIYGDCNENGVPDSCDIADGLELDANLNGIPDDCETGEIIVPPGNQFLRGDADSNGSFSALLDGLYIMRFSFASGDDIECFDAADADDSGTYSGLLDALYILVYAFQSGPVMPEPGPDTCGLDPDGDSDGLTCETPSDGC